MEEIKYLKHFTQLPVLLKILHTKHLTLGTTDNWNDLNDKAAIDAYKREKNVDQIRVLCLANNLEMVHHWFYYAKGKSGCCIMFKNNAFINRLNETKGVFLGHVQYISARELTAEKLKTFDLEKIPFVKRRPYECEEEYRVIWTGSQSDVPPDIPILDCIDYITLSPEFPEHTVEAVSDMFKSNFNIEVKRSRILQQEDWISKLRNYKG